MSKNKEVEQVLTLGAALSPHSGATVDCLGTKLKLVIAPPQNGSATYLGVSPDMLEDIDNAKSYITLGQEVCGRIIKFNKLYVLSAELVKLWKYTLTHANNNFKPVIPYVRYLYLPCHYTVKIESPLSHQQGFDKVLNNINGDFISDLRC